MTTLEQIKKEKQMVSRCENALAVEKLKKRKADTRWKIQLGGLVIKSGISYHKKSVILGGLVYLFEKIKKEEGFLSSLEVVGENLFKSK